jgi:hypothetical protein
MEYVKIALGNPVIIGVVFACLFVLAYIIVKKTKTTKDDEIFAMICNAFNIAENIIPDGKGPAWLQKADQALKVFKEEYAKREGKEPTQEIIQFAKDEWAKIALEIKKNSG